MGVVTLKDVSREAGVSMALVSTVLNNTVSRVKAAPATRQRIVETARRLGYVPNRNARALRLSRSSLIGVVTYSINTSFVPEILEGCEDFFLANNYGMMLTSFSGCDPESRESVLETFQERLEVLHRRNVDGLLLITGGSSELLQPVSEIIGKTPVVTLGSLAPAQGFSGVSVDSEAIGSLAAAAFAERGHRSVGFLRINGADGQLKGWQTEVERRRAAGWNVTAVSAACRNDFDESERAAAAFLDANPGVTAVFCGSDTIAAAMVKVAHLRGLRVPEDLAVLGVDDSLLCKMVTPELASISFPRRAYGEIGAKLLDARLHGKAPSQVLLPPQLVVRRSLGERRRDG